MLSILKNSVVTSASRKDVMIRKRELDWFTQNYWIIATQATVVAGFSFQQLTSTVPRGASVAMSTFYVFLTSATLMSSLYVIVRATFSSVLAPGLALKGANGFQSMTRAIEFLRKDQEKVLWCFIMALFSFLISSFIVVAMSPRKQRLVVRYESVLLFVSVAMAVLAWRVVLRFYFDRSASSGISAIETSYAQLGDIDACVEAAAP